MSSSAALPADQTEIATSLPTLTSTRLYPPRLRTNLVERSSLIARLSDDPERRLTVITAPAGYGKSTLAAQLVARLALPTAWVRLEATDDEREQVRDCLARLGLLAPATV